MAQMKGLTEAQVRFEVVDVTEPRSDHILQLTGGTTSLPVMELEDGRAIRESLVLMSYIEDRYPDPAIRSPDLYERAIERLLVTFEDDFAVSGYRVVMNQDLGKKKGLVERYLQVCASIDAFLDKYATDEGPWLLDRFGWAEVVFTPLFQRLLFLPYYDQVDVPDSEEFARFRAWRQACLQHPAAQQTTEEQIIKVYYDYSRGAGNGALVPGRRVSSFTFDSPWQDRPMPPAKKYGRNATDEELGLT